ncbi:MAG: hypothetical protein ABJC09_11625 [Terriglobia bacterium]
MPRRKLLGLLIPAGIAVAGLSSSFMMPLNDPAIDYARAPLDDAVARLQKRLDKGETRLRYEDEFGYLRSTLRELGVSTASQILVFSKTSFQAPRIAPRTPRALYFNDSVAVGFVRTGDLLEFAALDPKQGIVFYTLDQGRAAKPRFERRDDCLQCHQSGATMGIPGLMVRSVTTDAAGNPILSAGGFITDHRSPIAERWGGWYVTGTSGTQTHRGNGAEPTSNVTDLKPWIDTGAYLSPHSDIVALMTLEHQTRMDNLMIRVGWEARIAMMENDTLNKSVGEPEGQIRPAIQHRIEAASEDLLQYMLFRDEAKLTAPITGTSGFAEEFSKQGPRDSKGRSLRDFDLQTRMFKYPCSYMIYSEAFDGMPAVVKDHLYRRLWEEADPTVRQIIAETKKGLPAYWSQAR